VFVNFRKTSDVLSLWITKCFENLHLQADDAEIKRFIRVWLWHFLGAFLFLDTSGNTISWFFLDVLCQPWEIIVTYS
jgi:hypothetical protein